MNCSACKSRIDQLRDGELSARDARLVDAHLASCADCRSFADRLAHVESSLVRLAPVEPRKDFTLAVMAGIAAMPVPERQPARLWWLVVADIALWLALGALTALGAIRWKLVAATAGSFAAKAGITLGTLFNVAVHFHLTTIAALGGGIEVALVLFLAINAPRYLPRVRAALAGVLS